MRTNTSPLTMMKLLALAALTSSAAAFVIPDESVINQVSLTGDAGIKTNIKDATQKWWDSIPEEDPIFEAFEDTITTGFENGPLDLFDIPSVKPEWGGGHHGHHGDPTKTIYELIKESKYTTKFAELVETYGDIKDLLQATDKGNKTLFVPTDKAFERLPDHHKNPPKEFVLAVLKYHIVPGLLPAHALVWHHTLPTELTSHDLGNHPQRLRVRTGLFRLYVNFFSKVVAADIFAKNGVIHGVDSILVPPPSQEKIIQLIPSKFSTFRLAMEITGLGEDLDKREKEEKERNGGTLFAPTNSAFAKLGPRANAFLFSEYGKKYLRALLKYHIVANETLYSDAFYEHPKEDKDEDGGDDSIFDPDEEGNGDKSFFGEKEFKRIDLPTLLDEKPVSVGISRWKHWIRVKVNGRVPVVVQDGLARDGVIQVIPRVLIPPHKHHDHDHDHDGDDDGDDGDDDDDKEVEMDIDDLKARLEPYVEGGSVRGSESWLSEDL